MGRKSGKNSLGGNMTMIVFGTFLGIGADFMYNSLNLPGLKKPIQGCPALNEGDVIQLAVAAGITVMSFMLGSKSLPAFAFGVSTGMLIPKVFTPYLKMPRYVLFNFNSKTGAVNPIGRAPTL